MQNTSFDSLNLDEYTLDIQEVLVDYVIEKDIYKQNYSIHAGTMKNSSQKVRIYRRLFPTDPKSKERFRVLMTAFNQGIILADNIFLSWENQEHYLYIVEPWFTGDESKFVPLSHVLKKNINNAQKHRLFQNLAIIVKSLHELGEAHMELCPKNIWIEDEFQVYLRPFKLDIEMSVKESKSHNKKPKSKYWYSSPEYIAKMLDIMESDSLNGSRDSLDSSDEKSVNHFTNDIWSLGCIFADMFISLTPIFQAIEPFEKLVRIFEVMGIPRKEDVFYMTKELYESLIEQIQYRNREENQPPLIMRLIKNIPQEAAMVLTALILFNPDKRPSCERLVQFPFFKASTVSEYPNFFSAVGQPQIDYRKETPTSSTNRSESRNNLSIKSIRQEPCNVRIKTQSDRQNTSSWWNLDIFEEGPKERGTSYRLGEENQAVPNQDFASPTFLQGTEIQNFPKVAQNTLRDSKNDSRQSFGANQNQGQRFTEDPMRYTLGGNKERVSVSGTKSQRNEPSGMSNVKGNYEYDQEGPYGDSKKKNTQYSERQSLPPLDPRSTSYLKGQLEDEFEADNRVPDALRQSAMSRKSYRKHDSKFMVSVEQLKNVLYREGGYCCKVELRTGSSEGETASIMSNYVPVEESGMTRLELRSEIDTLFETLEKISKEDTLKIFIFYTQHPQGYNQTPEMLLYGICEINFDKLISNSQKQTSVWNNHTKTLTGWYNVYDPDDSDLTVGQLKVDLCWYMTGGSVTSSANFQQLPIEERKSIPTRHEPASQSILRTDQKNKSFQKEGKASTERKNTTTDRSQTTRRDKENATTSFNKPVVPKRTTEKKPLVSKENVFDIISKDLEKLDYELKEKEQEYKRENEILKQKTRDDHEFDMVVEKLREILEGEEEFCY